MNEEFVSFELAVKLKEKGFREECLYSFSYLNEIVANRVYNYEDFVTTEDLYRCVNFGDRADAPTISQVLKWLREKKIHIMIDIWKVDVDDTNYKWGYDIVNLTTTKVVGCDTQCADTYEQAALAGIEYVFDNLI